MKYASYFHGFIMCLLVFGSFILGGVYYHKLPKIGLYSIFAVEAIIIYVVGVRFGNKKPLE